MADADDTIADDDKARLARKWIGELGLSEKAQEKYLSRVRKIQKRYKLERSENTTRRQYAMLWSNTQTLLPAVWSRPPQPVVSRRFADQDPTGRSASEVLERCLDYSVDKQELYGTISLCAFDYILNARSHTWERYVPTHGPAVKPDPVPVIQITTDAGVSYKADDGTEYGDEQVTKDGTGYQAQPDEYEPVIYEESITDFVNIEDFGYTPSRTWDEVWYVWRRVFMTRPKLIERFGQELGSKIPLDYGPKKDTQRPEEETGKKAAIYEIWDKDERCVYWISKAWGTEPLDRREDPLGLDGFFPCPKPLFGTLTNDTLIPVPDFALYQDQAEEIDSLTAKIGQLQDSLKVAGFYAAEGKTDLNQLLRSGNTILIPVAEWQSLKDDGGLSGRIEWFPLEQVVNALKASIDLRAQLIEDVYQITGVADILRGASDPNETARAQGIKAQWGAVRIRDRQKDLARFARDILRIKAEVIAQHFSIDTLAKMSGVKLPTNAEKQAAQLQIQQAQIMARQQMAQQQAPQAPGQPIAPPQPAPAPQIPPEVQEMLQTPSWEDVDALLKDNATRSFRVDVETDSTIEPNEMEEKAQTVEFMGAIGQMIQTWGPAIQAAPALAPMAAQFIKWGARRFRAGRELETVIDQTMDKLAEGGIPPPAGKDGAGPPDQTPVAVASIKLQQEQAKQQGEMQRTAIEAQIHQEQMALEARDQVLHAQELRLEALKPASKSQ